MYTFQNIIGKTHVEQYKWETAMKYKTRVFKNSECKNQKNKKKTNTLN